MTAAILMIWLTISGAPGDPSASQEKVSVAMVAIQATNENGEEAAAQRKKTYDRAIGSAVRAAIERSDMPMPFDTFRQLRSDTATTAYGDEIQMKIDSRYTLFVSPVSKGRDGRIQTKVRIEIKDGKTTKNAVTTIVKAAPGDPLLLAGLKLDEGELIVALTLADEQEAASPAFRTRIPIPTLR